MGPKVVVITLGPRGCQVTAAESWSIPAPRVEAVDTAGHWEAVYLAQAGIRRRGWSLLLIAP